MLNKNITDQKINEKIIKFFSEKLKISEGNISLNAHLKDELGIDSVETMEIVAALEQEFAIKVPEEELAKIETVQNIIQAITKATNIS